MNRSARPHEAEGDGISRREALAALAKYSVALGGVATTIVSADGLVSAASAYPKKCLEDWSLPGCSNHLPPGQTPSSTSTTTGPSSGVLGGRVTF